jgi:hypothetical protein
MGINGQKRKKKEGPVPSLEESLPKKFKSDKTVKAKPEYGLKTKSTNDSQFYGGKIYTNEFHGYHRSS